MKLYITFFLCFIYALFCNNALAASIKDWYNGIYYATIDDYTAKVVKNPSGKYSGDIEIPNEVVIQGNTYKVTAIDSWVFSKCTEITSIRISDNVTTLGVSAFDGCTGLSEVKIGAGIKELNCNVFSGCSSLEHIIIPKTVDVISGIFNCPLVSAEIEDSDNILDWGDSYSPFYNNSTLRSLYIGRELRNRGIYEQYDFLRGTTVESLKIGSKVKTLSSRILHYFNGTSLVIPGNIEEGLAFEESPNLRDLFVDKGTKLGYLSFKKCPSITNLYYAGDSGYKFSYGGDPAWGGTGTRYHSMPSNQYILKCNPFYIDDATAFGAEYWKMSDIPMIYVPNVDRFKEAWPNWASKLVPLITIKPLTKMYDGLTPELEYTNAASECNVSISAQKNAGEYSSVEVVYSQKDWEVTLEDVVCNYTITKAPLSVIAGNATRKYGEENPTLTKRYVGFVNGETEDVLTTKPTVLTNATSESKPGTYPIYTSGAVAQNYELTYEQGTLTITKADQSISWNQSFAGVRVQDEVELKATATSGQSVSYSVSDETIARIVQAGGKYYLRALKPGKVMVYATQEGNDCYEAAPRVEREVEVNPILVESIKMNISTINLNIGGSISLKATVAPENATTPNVVWSSSDENIATVENGEVTAVGVGKATITATTTDGTNLSATCAVTVKPILVTGLTLSDNSLTIENGNVDALIATITPSNATTKTLTWTSSNANVAEVSDGVITAKSIGVAIITAATTDGTNLSAQCKVTVIASTKAPLVFNVGNKEMHAGESYQLTASVEGVAQTASSITWRSNDETVATVLDGLITAVGVGETTILGTMNDGSNRTAQCKVTVLPIMAESVVMNVSSLEIGVGETMQLKATVFPENATNQILLWESSNEAVATVSNTGLVSTVGAGFTIITASATDGSGVEGTCTITVESSDGIISINSQSSDAQLYDVTGRKLNKLQRGLNIMNGNKVLR